VNAQEDDIPAKTAVMSAKRPVPTDDDMSNK
jgi:hypothetical protein